MAVRTDEMLSENKDSIKSAVRLKFKIKMFQEVPAFVKKRVNNVNSYSNFIPNVL